MRCVPFVARVHTLVNLVDQSEWGTGETLQRHEVEDGGDSAFATRLTVVVKDRQRLGFAERNC